MPYAPGTFGSAVGFFVVALLTPGSIQLIIFFLLIFLLGMWAAHSTEKLLGKDSGHIVIDEFCGYLISVLFIPEGISYLLAAFILFRIFDILKPPPIRKIEEIVAGGAGIMLDDVLAGICGDTYL
jgi:phosphatidylglycerophosphatase A